MIQPCKSHIGLPLLQRFAYIWAFAIINRLGTHGLRQLSFCSTFCTPTSTSPIFIPVLLSFSRFEVTVSSGDFYKPLRSRAVLPIHCSRGDALQVKVHLTPQLPIAWQRQGWQLESFRRSYCTKPWPWTLWEMYAASQLLCIRTVCWAVLKARIPSNLPAPITEGTHFDKRIKTIHTWLFSDLTFATMPTASDRPASEEQEHVQQLSFLLETNIQVSPFGNSTPRHGTLCWCSVWSHWRLQCCLACWPWWHAPGCAKVPVFCRASLRVKLSPRVPFRTAKTWKAFSVLSSKGSS